MTLIRHGQPVITRVSPHNANTRFIKSKTNQGGGGGGPIVLDTFTDTNGTALASHTPDVDTVGGGWTSAYGTQEIDTNKVKATTYVSFHGSSFSVAKIDASIADVFIEMTGNPYQFGAGIDVDYPEICLRIDSGGDWWSIQLNVDGDKLRIIQRESTTNTERAFSSVTINSGTDYKVTAIADSADITAFIDDADSCTYGSATMNQTETNHGLSITYNGSGNGNARIDNFAIYPRSG